MMKSLVLRLTCRLEARRPAAYGHSHICNLMSIITIFCLTAVRKINTNLTVGQTTCPSQFNSLFNYLSDTVSFSDTVILLFIICVQIPNCGPLTLKSEVINGLKISF
jgi:hypothetical protein